MSSDQPKPTPYFGKNWRVSSHGIFNGTMRIAKFDFDTDPSDEVKEAMYSEILALLRAQDLTADNARLRELLREFYIHAEFANQTDLAERIRKELDK